VLFRSPPPPPLAAILSTQSGARRDAGAGVWASALSLSLTTMGAGVLSFPYAAAQTGLLPLLALVVALGALSAYCSLINAEVAWRLRARVRARTFDELAALALGRVAYAPAAAQVLLGLAGTLVGFLCVAGDLGAPVLGAHLGGRAGVVLLFAAAVVLPLSGCARIHSLRGSSLLGVAAVVAVVALLVSRGAAAAAGAPPLALTVRAHAALRPAAPALSQAVLACPIDTVIWNPGEARAAAIADLGAGEWRDYVCVEPGRVSAETAGAAPQKLLAPGWEWTQTQNISVS